MEYDRDWKQFIGRVFTDSSSGDRYSVENPATAETIAHAPDGTAADVDQAVSTATEAFEEWRWTEPRERADLLLEVADLLDEHREELVELSTTEAGKALEQSRRDVENATKLSRFFAGAADKWYSESVLDTPMRCKRKSMSPTTWRNHQKPPLTSTPTFPRRFSHTGSWPDSQLPQKS